MLYVVRVFDLPPEICFKKGATVGNIVIMLSAWAVIKIPMLFVEAKFLGLRFTLIRYLLTVPCIFALGYLGQKLVSRQDIDSSLDLERTPENKLAEEVLQLLPGYNCRACGFPSCQACAQAIAAGNTHPRACRPGGEQVHGQIELLCQATANP